MIIIRLNKERYIFGRIRGILIFPFLFCIKDFSEKKIIHEKIHQRQFLEIAFLSALIVVILLNFGIIDSFYWFFSVYSFYFFYELNYLYNLIKYKNKSKAYINVIFEREAFNGTEIKNYLINRIPFQFIKYFKWQ